MQLICFVYMQFTDGVGLTLCLQTPSVHPRPSKKPTLGVLLVHTEYGWEELSLLFGNHSNLLGGKVEHQLDLHLTAMEGWKVDEWRGVDE